MLPTTKTSNELLPRITLGAAIVIAVLIVGISLYTYFALYSLSKPHEGYFDAALVGVTFPIPSHSNAHAVITFAGGPLRYVGVSDYDSEGQQWTAGFDGSLQVALQKDATRWYLVPFSITKGSVLEGGADSLQYIGLFSQEGDEKMIYHDALLIAPGAYIEHTPNYYSENFAVLGGQSGNFFSTYSTATGKTEITYRLVGNMLQELKREQVK